MNGQTHSDQTRIEPCEICGEPSVAEVELTPPVHEIREGKKELVTLARTRLVCATHKEAVERDRGWQKRHADRRRQGRKAMSTDQTALFDDRRPWEDVL